MTAIRVYHDQQGNALTVWFGNPEEEVEAEETGEEVVLMKDKDGRVIDFEKLNVHIASMDPLQVALETLAA